MRINYRKFEFVIITAVVLSLTSGCSSWWNKKTQTEYNQVSFDTLADEITPNGSFYLICTQENAKKSFARALQSMQRSIAASKLPLSTASTAAGQLAGAELVIRLIGLPDLAGIAVSSVPAKDKGVFDNRIFIASERNNAPGPMWHFCQPGGGNINRLQRLGELPEESCLAFSYNFDAKYTMECLKTYGLLQTLNFIPQGIIEKICSSVSGEWRFAVFDFNAKSGELNFLLEMPDKNAAIGNLLKTAMDISTASNEFSSKDGKISFSSTNNMLRISSRRKYFKKSDKMLKNSPEFRKYASGLRQNCGIAWFVSADFAKKCQISEEHFATADCKNSELGVASPFPGGWRITIRSNADFNQMLLDDLIITPLQIFGDFILNSIKSNTTTENAGQNNSADSADKKTNTQALNNTPPDTLTACKSAMQNTVPVIKKHGQAAVKKNQYGCGFLYLTPPENAPQNWPLLLDLPGNHSNGFNVMYLSGNCESIQLDRPDNIRRIISALHSKNGYSEEIFMQLLETAEREYKKSLNQIKKTPEVPVEKKK